MLKRVQIPDVLPSGLPPGSNFSLVAGDFEDVYGQQDGDADPDEPSAGLWDAVLTCFFIDTVTTCSLSCTMERISLMYYAQAKNIVNYLRIIHRILAPGGVWINLGMETIPSMSHASFDSESQLGPLLWHFEENTTSDPSIELDLEEVKTLAAHIGFEIKVGISCPSLISRPSFTVC